MKLNNNNSHNCCCYWWMWLPSFAVLWDFEDRAGMRSYSSLNSRGQQMALIPNSYSGSEYLWDVWVQEWQGPKTRAIREPTNTLLITPPSAWPSFWAPVAIVQSQPNCPGAGFLHPCLQTATKEVLLLLCRWQHHGSCLWDSASWGLMQVDPVTLAKRGLGVAAAAALPRAPMTATRAVPWTLYLVSFASQHGQFIKDVRLCISYRVVYI